MSISRVQKIAQRLALACTALMGATGGASATCWDHAASLHAVHPNLLRAIAWQESRGQPHAVGPLLAKGERALGLMQINTVHLPVLRQWGVKREDLFEPCKSVLIGAWVLRDCINRFGELWRSVACYYGGPRSKAYVKHAIYVKDVQAHFLGYQAVYNIPALAVAAEDELAPDQP